MTNYFLIDKDFESLEQILNRVCKKHGLTPAQVKFNRYYSRRPTNKVADARAEYAYEAYKTGNFSLTNVARGIGRISSEFIGTRRGPSARRRIIDLIHRHCNMHGLEFPRWPLDSEPYWRVREDAQNQSDGTEDT